MLQLNYRADLFSYQSSTSSFCLQSLWQVGDWGCAMTHRLLWKHPNGEPQAEQGHGTTCSGLGCSVPPGPCWHPWAQPVPQQGCHRRLVFVTGNVAPSAGCGENHTAALPRMSGIEISLPSAKESGSSRNNQSTFPSLHKADAQHFAPKGNAVYSGKFAFQCLQMQPVTLHWTGHICLAVW